MDNIISKAIGTRIIKAYTDKAMYSPGDTVIIYTDVANSSSVNETVRLTATISYLDEIRASVYDSITVQAGTNNTASLQWVSFNDDFRGYLVTLTIDDENPVVTAIDISSNVSRYPRYGYSVDFPVGETASESRRMSEELVRDYHINLVQYYDWMWRHDKIVPDGDPDEWVDLFGRIISRTSITQRIDSAHAMNQKAMAYQMAFMGREAYQQFGVSPQWGLFRSGGNNVDYDPSNPETIYDIDQLIFPLEGNPFPILFAFYPQNVLWQQYIVGQYIQAINKIGFDGIQIDQLGDFWGYDISYYDYNGNQVDLANSFSSITNYAKQALLTNSLSKSIVTMNVVNGAENDYFSTHDIIENANTDFAFSEIWGNGDTYNKLYQFSNWQRMRDGGKTMVLAAYMNRDDINGVTYMLSEGTLNGTDIAQDGDVTYVTGFDSLGDGVSITVDAPEDGIYSLVFLASNGTDYQISKSVYIDNVKNMTAFFDATRDGLAPAPANWSKYSYEASFTLPKNLYMKKGTHIITIQQDDDDTSSDVRIVSITLSVFDMNSVRLANASFAAGGMMHIELGVGMTLANNPESNYCGVTMLGDPYYPKASKSMRSDLANYMKKHYQFITAYENLLYDPDILPSDVGLQNISIAGENVSGSASPQSIWFINRNKGTEYGIIHLINLSSKIDENWRNVTDTPIQKNNLAIKYYYPPFKTIVSIFIASPDTDCMPHSLEYVLGKDTTGTYVSFTVPSLEYWDMICIRWGEETSPDIVEAEDSILSNVSVSTNHPGYTGTGFVDSFGTMFSSVTFDITTEEAGNYSLGFRYTNATATDNKRALIVDDFGAGDVLFPRTTDWDTWEVAETIIYLRKGLHRLVLLTVDEESYINLDHVEVKIITT